MVSDLDEAGFFFFFSFSFFFFPPSSFFFSFFLFFFFVEHASAAADTVNVDEPAAGNQDEPRQRTAQAVRAASADRMQTSTEDGSGQRGGGRTASRGGTDRPATRRAVKRPSPPHGGFRERADRRRRPNWKPPSTAGSRPLTPPQRRAATHGLPLSTLASPGLRRFERSGARRTWTRRFSIAGGPWTPDARNVTQSRGHLHVKVSGSLERRFSGTGALADSMPPSDAAGERSMSQSARPAPGSRQTLQHAGSQRFARKPATEGHRPRWWR